jgi:ubiquinol oxidase
MVFPINLRWLSPGLRVSSLILFLPAAMVTERLSWKRLPRSRAWLEALCNIYAPCAAWKATHTLLDEAENERMHLMTFINIAQPTWLERLIILLAQGAFFNGFFLLYLLSPRTAHRVVGYFEEEAVHSYTEYLNDVDSGIIANVPAPKIAIDYWKLAADSRLRDVIIVVREDERHHRDVNHEFADALA